MDFASLDEAFKDPREYDVFNSIEKHTQNDNDFVKDNSATILEEQTHENQQKKEYFDNLWSEYKKEHVVQPAVNIKQNNCNSILNHINNCMSCKEKFNNLENTKNDESGILLVFLVIFLFWIFTKKTK